MELPEKLDGIIQKVRLLGQKLERVTQENATLRLENEQLKTEIDRQKGLVEDLQDKLADAVRLKEQQRRASPAMDSAIRQQIDHYLREIDHCIEWLQQH